jgi:CobQ-like glutamine amidotransferase family enzyme
MDLRICHLFPDLLNLYGDRGNIATLTERARWRGIDVRVTPCGIGESIDPDEHDLYFIGGGEDRQQRLAAPDLKATKGPALREACEHGAVLLAVCGGYQLLGHFFGPADGPELEGLGILDLHTQHPGPTAPRLIGNIAIEETASGRRLVGFENHGGRTYLGANARPLGTVFGGWGNNGEDRTEGAVWRNVFGTYLHGPLLPKNAWFADHLLTLALRRRHPGSTLAPLDNTIEDRAAAAAMRRVPGASGRPRRSA